MVLSCIGPEKPFAAYRTCKTFTRNFTQIRHVLVARSTYAGFQCHWQVIESSVRRGLALSASSDGVLGCLGFKGRRVLKLFYEVSGSKSPVVPVYRVARCLSQTMPD